VQKPSSESSGSVSQSKIQKPWERPDCSVERAAVGKCVMWLATKKGDLNNNIAEHHLKTNHGIDWDSATCLTYSTHYYKGITLKLV